jgi:gliding motility-associated-like protein
LYSQDYKNVFHTNEELHIHETPDNLSKLHFLNQYFTEVKLKTIVLNSADRLKEEKLKYSNSKVSFEKAYSLVLNSEAQQLKKVAISKTDLSKPALRDLCYELFEKTISKIHNTTYVNSLYDHDNTLQAQYKLYSGYYPKVAAACTNVDFADGTVNGWQCSWGTGAGNQISAVVGYEVENDCGILETYNAATQECCPILFGSCSAAVLSTVAITANINNPAVTGTANSGPVNSAANSGGAGVHTVMTGGNDPLVPIPVVPPGGGNSVRLGNSTINQYKAQRIRQTFTVGAGNPNFVYQYAVVIEDPGAGHTVSDQPYFKIRMYDQSNNLIDCATYDVDAISAPSIGGFQSQGSYLYKNWSTVTVPLGAYVGQNVTIEFTTSDCALGGHFGYAYIQCLCSPIPIVSSLPVVCNGQTTTLTAPPGAATYTWSGPSVVSGTNTQTAVVNVGGTYVVNMTTFYSFPQVPCAYSQTITLPGAPSAATSSFVSSPVCLGAPNTFTNTSSGVGIFQYIWDFGDGSPTFTTSTATNPVHTYTAANNYSVSLIADNGCPSPFILPLVIKPQPTADFTLTNSCMGAATNFTNSSTAPVPATFTSHTWNFGDGNTSTTIGNASHTFTTPNTYSVSLLVVNDQQCRDSVTKTITIYPNPTISIAADNVCLNTITSFSNSSSVAAPDNIASWAWDFDNNGVTDNTSQSPTNTYTNSGNFTVELKATTNNGCRDSSTINITVNALPTASFTPSNACVNANVTLNNSSNVPLPDNITDYSWIFGSGSNPATSAIQNPPLLSYNTSGVKTITLNITANTSCTASITQTIQVFAQPVANFSATAVCQSTATAFTDLSTPTGSITNWAWDFTNNNSTDNITNAPTTIYASSGTFTTSLIVTDNNSCKDTMLLPINVWGHAIPDFSPNNVCYGTATTFTNLTNVTTNANLGGAPTYLWDFNDGSATSNAISPNHTYNLGANANAVYNVTLTATTTNNCIDQIVKAVNVYAVPTASFTADSVCLGSTTQLLDASNGNGNALSNYVWDFQNNGTIDATGISNPNFIFPSFGINNVSYTVSTTPVAGLTCSNATTSYSVWVNPIPVPDFTFVNKCINAQPNTFDASGSTIAAGTNTAYVWSYGDAGVGTGITSSHVFGIATTFNTTLTVTSNKGCQASIVKQVEAYKKPIFTVANSTACDKKAMTFTATPSPGSGTVSNANWNWDFNNFINTVEANGQNVGFTFPSAGQQTVSVIGTTNNNCKDTATVFVYVDYLPSPQFTVNIPSGCPTHCVVFTDVTAPVTTPAINTNWKWVFGDGQTMQSSSNGSQSHCYQNSSSNQLANFDVKLIVTTDKGCTDSLNKPSFITVYPKPIAQYIVNPNPESILTPVVYFENQSQDYIKWNWNFGDNSSKDSVTLNPYHTYNSDNAGSYYSTLIVTNQYGCKDTANVMVKIEPEFTFYIPNAFTPGNTDGINDMFTGYGIGIETFELLIFDRWGEKIFSTTDINKGWDGSVKGSLVDVKMDVYVWKVRIKDVLGKFHDYAGHVTVVK